MVDGYDPLQRWKAIPKNSVNQQPGLPNHG
jgi:hypothetical protein